MRIIVSSKFLRSVLVGLDLDLMDSKEQVTIECKNDQVSFNGRGLLHIHSKEKNFEVKHDVYQLVKLSKICGMLEDQPLTIIFEDSHWITINGVTL